MRAFVLETSYDPLTNSAADSRPASKHENGEDSKLPHVTRMRQIDCVGKEETVYSG